MVELEFTKSSVKDLCPIALRLAAVLCSGQEAVLMDKEHTMVAVPKEVIEHVKSKAGNPGTMEEIMSVLKELDWSRNWAEGLCSVAVGRDSPYFNECVDRMIRKLAENIREKQMV